MAEGQLQLATMTCYICWLYRDFILFGMLKDDSCAGILEFLSLEPKFLSPETACDLRRENFQIGAWAAGSFLETCTMHAIIVMSKF